MIVNARCYVLNSGASDNRHCELCEWTLWKGCNAWALKRYMAKWKELSIKWMKVYETLNVNWTWIYVLVEYVIMYLTLIGKILWKWCDTMTYYLNLNVCDCLCRLKDIKLCCGKTHLSSVTQWTHMLVMQIMWLKLCAWKTLMNMLTTCDARRNLPKRFYYAIRCFCVLT